MSENGTIYIKMVKNGVSHILFLRKWGLIVYLAVLKKGASRAAHPYYVIYYTIIDFNEVDIRIYLPEKVIIH